MDKHVLQSPEIQVECYAGYRANEAPIPLVVSPIAQLRRERPD